MSQYFIAKPITPETIGNNPLLRPIAVLDSKPLTDDYGSQVSFNIMGRLPYEGHYVGKVFQTYNRLTPTIDLHLKEEVLLQPWKNDINHIRNTDIQEECSSPTLDNTSHINGDLLEELSRQRNKQDYPQESSLNLLGGLSIICNSRCGGLVIRLKKSSRRTRVVKQEN